MDILVDPEVDPHSPRPERPMDPWTLFGRYALFHAFTRGGALTTRFHFPRQGRLMNTHSIEPPHMVK